MLDLGPIEHSLAKQSYSMGQPLPDRIANAPELTKGLQLFLQAFFDLDSERSHGFGVTLIPWSRIKDYAVAYDMDEDQTDYLITMIRRMDLHHTKKLNEKQKAEQIKNKRNGKKSK